MRRKTWVAVLAAALLVAFALVAWWWHRPVEPDWVTADAVVLYALDGHSGPEDLRRDVPGERLHGFLVLGKVDVSDAATRRSLAREFAAAVAEPTVPKKCFWPRHAVRVVRGGATTDRLICFQCNNYERWVNDDRDTALTQPIAPTARPVFDAPLAAAGLSHAVEP